MTVTSARLVLDQADTAVAAAQDAEQHLFEHFGLQVKSEYVRLDNGLRVRTMVSGKGQPLVLMPGGVGDGWIWAPLMAELDGYRLIVVNRPGGGLSDGVDHRQVDVRQLAVETLSAVFNHFDLDRVPIVCNSMGGLWSFWFALAHPERVTTLVQFGCPALILDTSAPLPMRLMSLPLLNRLLVKTMIPNDDQDVRQSPTFLGHPPEVGNDWPQAMVDCAYQFRYLPTYRTAWLSLMEAVLRPGGAEERYALDADELKRVQVPVHYVWGDDDPFGDMEAARKAAELTPDATLHEWRGGHLPWWDDAAKCSRLLRAFVSEETGEATPA
jgi:pimeloyl-ACP methyl ester carboxylesterase